MDIRERACSLFCSHREFTLKSLTACLTACLTRHLLPLVLACCLTTGLVHPKTSPGADSQPDDEGLLSSKVKAAYVYNFCKFVEWPADAFTAADSTLSLCILGEDVFGNLFDPVLDKPVQGRKLIVRKCTSPAGAARCQIVFLSRSEAKQVDRILRSLADSHCLTISDIEGFAERGGMVGFYEEAGRIRFKINLEAATRAGITFSSMIIEIATRAQTRTDGD